MIRVTVWGEFRHEKTNKKVAAIYPDGIHEAIASHLRKSPDLRVTTATLDEREHGLPEKAMKEVDVLVWWGHAAHDDVSDKVAARVVERVWAGMGFVCLHS